MQFARKSAINLFGNALLAIIGLAIGILLARLLSPAGLGQYALATSAVAALAYISTMSLGQAGIYFINNQNRDPKTVTSLILKWQLGTACLAAGIIYLALHYESYFGKLSPAAMFFIVLYGISILLTSTLKQVLLAFLRVKQFVIVGLIPSVVFLSLILGSIAFANLDVMRAWSFIALGQFFGLIVLLFFLREWIQLNSAFSWTEFKPVVAFGAKLSVAQVTHLLHGELALLLLRYFSNNFEQIGYYRASIRLAGVILLVAGSITPLLYAHWSGASSEQRRMQAERVSRCFWTFIIPSVVALELIAAWAIPTIYGSDYQPAVIVFRFVIFGVAARFLLSPFIQLFAGGGKPFLTTIILGTSLVLMAVCMSYLAPRFEALGAAIAFASSSIVALLLGYIVAATVFKIRIRKCFLINRGDIHYLGSAIQPAFDKLRNRS